MNLTEKRAMELQDLVHNGKFDQHRAWDCAVTAINDKAAHDKLKWAVRKLQRDVTCGSFSEVEEIKRLIGLGEIAAKHYVRIFPEHGSWNLLMDVPTRCACGQRIVRLLWEH